LGWSAADIEPPPVEVWPDCWDAAQVFIAMSTQWRVGPASVSGLDYSVLPWVMQQYGISDTAGVFEDVRIMEYAALQQMSD
jgi:hypothetical protein